ncbi:FtsK/SpoIIIE domain-containing protein [Modestobacter lapidis]|nr:FHA domain-containing protein [Modestobacter lapidis]
MTHPSPAADVPGTRGWTLDSPEGSVDVEVAATDTSTVADVLAALRDQLGLPASSLWAGPAALDGSTSLSSAVLRHGAVLGLGRPGPVTAGGTADPGGASGGALELHVVGGPDAGRILPLEQGDLVVGRGTGCAVALTDPGVSRRHLRIGVGGGQVTAADLGSANGSRLLGPAGTVAVTSTATAWPVGAVLVLGSTAIRLTGPRGVQLDRRPAPAGREQVRPLRATPPPAAEVTVTFPAEPAQRSGRRLGWVAVAVPAVAGLLMAWLLATPQFLFFALLSPVVAVGSWVSDRVTGRRDRRHSTAGHRAATAEAQTRLVAAVAAAGAALDEAHPDPATLVAAVHRRSGPLWSRTAGGPGGPTVRLGLGPGPTAVTLVAPDGQRSPAVAEHLPVTVDLGSSAGLGVVGPRAPGTAVVRALLLQLTALLPPGELSVVVAAAPDRSADWRWVAWLPHLAGVVECGPDDPAADARLLQVLAGCTPPEPRPGPLRRPPVRLVVLDTDVRPETAAALTAGERVVCVAVASSGSRLAVSPTACLTVTGETGTVGRLRAPGHPVDRELTLDGVSVPVAAATARSLAGLAALTTTTGLPDSCRLLDLPGVGLHIDAATGTAAGAWPRSRRALVCVLGEDERGPVVLDLCAQGPHALVAGTTGSGKSELLQTLVAGLALHQPPDRVSFLLVDYKGGAAFAEAARLPHTVGVLTDLDPQSTGRALRSLTAELSRRERVLAGHGVRDVGELAAEVTLPRLVIVVDEFATLAEELPDFVSGLVGIAQRGRSLGVHLVLATQRPSGVVSPEIRANCSLRICLRTTDESDSRDVLGSPLAALLPVHRPGRAYLRVGSAAPVLLQVARVAGAPALRPAGGVQVRRRPWPAATPSVSSAAPAPDGIRPAGDLAGVVDALGRRAAHERISPVGRPWLPPLPDQLPAEQLDRCAPAGAPATQLRVGLLDCPDSQSQDPLVLDLAAGGGWLAAGGPRSGRTTALRAVLREAVHRLPPARLHVHVLDHGGGGLAAEASGLAHAGTTVDRNDPYRTERLMARLQAVVDQRRSDGPAGAPHLLLLVDGVESVSAQLDDADPGNGSAALLRLVREGAAAGLTCVLSADRAVPGSRLAAAAATRLVLPLPDRADYAVAGVPPRAVPASRPPGRALVGEDAVECQLVLPRRPGGESTGRSVPDPARRQAISIVPLPADPVAELPAGASGSDDLWLPIGPGADDGASIGIDLVRSGGLLVVGPPTSGRSSALRAFARHCRHAGARVLHLGTGPQTQPADLAEEHIGPDDVAAVQTWVSRVRGCPAVVVADDVGTLADAMADALAALARPRGELLVLAAGGAAELAGTFRGPTVALRRTRTALLLRPGPGDGQVLGLRLPRVPLPARPGSGWLVVAGTTTRVQVARHRVTAGG